MKSIYGKRYLSLILCLSLVLVILSGIIIQVSAADITFGVDVGETAIWRFPSSTNVIYEKQTCISKILENATQYDIHARFENYSISTGQSVVVENQTYRYIEPVEWVAPGGDYELLGWIEEAITVKAGTFTCLRNDYSSGGEDGSVWWDRTTGLKVRWDWDGDMIQELVSLVDADLTTLSEELEVPELRDHDPINIYVGSNNVVGENGITRGAGTENDPYIIEWWNIIPRTTETQQMGIQFTGVGEYYLVANCSISGWTTTDWAGGISLVGVNHVDIKDCNITDCSIGINLISAGSDGADMTMANNIINDSGVNGIKLQRGQGDTNWDCHRIIITGNKIDSVETTDSSDEARGNGITVYAAGDCQITGNTILSCVNYGIYLENDDSSVYGNTVTGNNLCGNNNGAFNYHEDIVDNNTIENNQCAGSSTDIPGFTVHILLTVGLVIFPIIRKKRT